MFHRSLAIISAALLAAAAVAGPLTPPPGPITPTHKTLTEIEPRIAINATNTPGTANATFRITEPGSYYLTANITGEPNKHGILITATEVTLDLNGFALIGVETSLNGVSAGSGAVVRNGHVRGWTNGVLVSQRSRIESITASQNTGSGLRAGSAGFLIQGCVAVSNLGVGIITSCCGDIVDTHVANNTQGGINAGTSITIKDCTVTDNDSFGIAVAGDSVVSGCAVTFNGTDGITVGSGTLVLNNLCSVNGSLNDGANILVTGSDNRIEGNNCRVADRGIEVNGTGNIIIRNTCSGNTVNWDIAANNIVGPIIDRTIPASAAISGNSAPDSTGSTHPNANFTY